MPNSKNAVKERNEEATITAAAKGPGSKICSENLPSAHDPVLPLGKRPNGNSRLPVPHRSPLPLL